MTTVGAEQARKELAELLRRAGYAQERIVISVHGRATAALVSIDDLRALEGLHDLLDRLEGEEALAAVADGREQTFTLEEADGMLGQGPCPARRPMASHGPESALRQRRDPSACGRPPLSSPSSVSS